MSRPYYQQQIAETLARTGRLNAADPRHVEAYMRLEFSTLDHLGGAAWTRAVSEALDCVEADPAMAERLAQSEGL
jgi:hypothetical protein